jgi:hypothetical protein
MRRVSLHIVGLALLYLCWNAWAVALPAVAGSSASDLSITSSGFRRDQRTGELVQAVTVVSRGNKPLPGNLVLVLDGLDPAIAATSKSKRINVGGNGARAFVVDIPRAASGLAPGQKVTTIIRFKASDKQRVRYTPRVLLQQKTN